MSQYNGRLNSSLATEMKLNSFLYVIDVAILGGAIIFWNVTKDWIASIWVNAIYLVALLIVTFFTIYQPRRNPRRRNYQVLRYAFIRDKSVYHTITRSEIGFLYEDLKQREADSRYIDLNQLEEDTLDAP